jgi:hypothetical protein
MRSEGREFCGSYFGVKLKKYPLTYIKNFSDIKK